MQIVDSQILCLRQYGSEIKFFAKKRDGDEFWKVKKFQENWTMIEGNVRNQLNNKVPFFILVRF